MATFFTADTHFGDAHVLRRRGHLFASVEAHDEALIARWNEVVSPDDDTWHVGDFAANTSRTHCVSGCCLDPIEPGDHGGKLLRNLQIGTEHDEPATKA